MRRAAREGTGRLNGRTQAERFEVAPRIPEIQWRLAVSYRVTQLPIALE